MIVYKVVNKINSKVYVGQTTQDLNHRIMEHLSESKTKGIRIIGRAFKKYGIGSFEISVIDLATSRETLDEKERYWIAFYGCINPNGYNLTEGGNGTSGYHLSEEVRKRMSIAKKGKPSSRKGIPVSEETKAKLREYKGKKASMYGKHLGAEAKQKLSKAHMGKTLSGEHRQKLSEAHKGKPGPWAGKSRPETTRQKISEGLKGNIPWNSPKRKVE